MTLTNKTSHLPLKQRLVPAIVTGLGLSFATYGLDFLMDWFGTTASKTLLNDVVIGMLGGFAVFFYLGASHDRANYEFAKERMRMVSELNWRVRQALELVATSAMSEDRQARLRGIDEAAERIDSILSDFSVKPGVEETTVSA